MLLGADGKVDTVTVDLGELIRTAGEVPALSASERMVEETLPTAKHGDFAVTAVSMGNPHGVIFVDEITDELVLGAGPELERHSAFTDRANKEIVKVNDGEKVQMRVWERGSGETLACGTGACATAVAAALTGRTNRKVTVKLIGGDLSIEWNEKDNHVYLTGPARAVFAGVWTL